MFHDVGQFLLQLHARGLSHEAVIEIMLAILGGMIAVLALISAAGALIVSVIGWFGYQAIRDGARKTAEDIAMSVAIRKAEEVANRTLNQLWKQAQASGMSEAQVNMSTQPGVGSKAPPATPPKRRKTMMDSSFRKGGNA